MSQANAAFDRSRWRADIVEKSGESPLRTPFGRSGESATPIRTPKVCELGAPPVPVGAPFLHRATKGRIGGRPFSLRYHCGRAYSGLGESPGVGILYTFLSIIIYTNHVLDSLIIYFWHNNCLSPVPVIPPEGNQGMTKLGVFLAIGVLIGSFGTAYADVIDPLFGETLTNTCPANCLSVADGVDPISGMTTLEYVFYNSGDLPSTGTHSPISAVVAGDVKVLEFGGSTVGDLIRFENTGGSAVAFIFSSDISGGLAADVGLPTTFQANTVTISENSSGGAPAGLPSSPYTPSSTQPGHCTSCSSSIAYGLQSPDLIPEPGTLTIMGIGLLGMGAARRLRKG